MQMHSDGLDIFGGAQLTMHLKSAGSAGMSERCHHHGLMAFLPALSANWMVSFAHLRTDWLAKYVRWSSDSRCNSSLSRGSYKGSAHMMARDLTIVVDCLRLVADRWQAIAILYLVSTVLHLIQVLHHNITSCVTLLCWCTHLISSAQRVYINLMFTIYLDWFYSNCWTNLWYHKCHHNFVKGSVKVKMKK